MGLGNQYADPNFNVVMEVGLGAFNSNATAAQLAGWKPFAKAKVLAVIATVYTAGSLACGFNVYKNSTSIGTIVCSASAYGYQGTFAPTAGAQATFDTTDALSIANIDSNASLKASLSVAYQNQY